MLELRRKERLAAAVHEGNRRGGRGRTKDGRKPTLRRVREP